MKIRFLFFLLFLLLASTTQAQEIPDQVKASYETYRQAVLDGRGMDAANLTTANTIAYYDSMATLARNADSLLVDSMDIIDKMMVLILRSKTPTETLREMKGNQVFAYAVDEGMVSREDVRNNQLGEVFFDETVARATLIVNSQETPFQLYFRLEEGQWKVDISSLNTIATIAMNQLVAESEMTENELIEMLINISLAGKEPANALWKSLEEGE